MLVTVSRKPQALPLLSVGSRAAATTKGRFRTSARPLPGSANVCCTVKTCRSITLESSRVVRAEQLGEIDCRDQLRVSAGRVRCVQPFLNGRWLTLRAGRSRGHVERRWISAGKVVEAGSTITTSTESFLCKVLVFAAVLRLIAYHPFSPCSKAHQKLRFFARPASLRWLTPTQRCQHCVGASTFGVCAAVSALRSPFRPRFRDVVIHLWFATFAEF